MLALVADCATRLSDCPRPRGGGKGTTVRQSGQRAVDSPTVDLSWSESSSSWSQTLVFFYFPGQSDCLGFSLNPMSRTVRLSREK